MIAGSLDRLRNLLGAILAQLWLVPAVMSVGAVFAARVVVNIDQAGGLPEFEVWWRFGGEADTARELLSTLLSGMITMSSLVISITMVVLSLAANQLGPRLIGNFMRDRQIQFVIGLFFGTIFFILTVARSVSAESVPEIAVTLSTLLVGLCLFALLFHIHKVARSIIADTVIGEVAESLVAAIAELPEAADEPREELSEFATTAARLPEKSALTARRSGYVQVVEYGRLARHAKEHDLAISVKVRPGHFVLGSELHLEVRHDGDLDEKIREKLEEALLIGSQRTATQDLEYSIRQLVEIALRALSPSVNDPFTAITIVHRLGDALARLANRSLPDLLTWPCDDGTVRVVGDASTFRGLVDVAFNQIRQAADSDPAVLISMGKLIGQLATAVRTAEQVGVLRDHLEMLARAVQRTVSEERDRRDFAVTLDDARTMLDRAPLSP